MLPNLLIALGIVLVDYGAWLKFRSAPEPSPVEVAAAAESKYREEEPTNSCH